jgi:transcriptional regulator with XRE-family HTH domain
VERGGELNGSQRKARSRLATILRVAREGVGLSQDELAFKVGVDGSYISHIEAGKKVPSENLIKLIVAALGLTEEEKAVVFGLRILANNSTMLVALRKAPWGDS